MNTTTVNAVAISRRRKRDKSPMGIFFTVLKCVGVVSVIGTAISMSSPGLALSMLAYIGVKSTISLFTRKAFKALHRKLKKIYPEVGSALIGLEPELDKLRKIPLLPFFMGAGVSTSIMAPANAQFFSAAETFFGDTFGESIPEEIISVIFGVLRALILLYLAIALIQIINAARQDQDWQQVARTPLIVAVTVGIGEVLSGMIIGDGGGGGGGEP
ncbi:MAG: hypothetical protein F6K22_02455 [Okeania sp. SIO2F4]|uniref:hypothetical protein n=1 Tax=Okeania sp. SIO2F4 TaxID=2607790 RepID=UPI00142D0541|nr:hypothetical protein [Okeania sp. SIO2F4]NES01785.1 hypothetical protein [Okeania sp. SIO2F4]